MSRIIATGALRDERIFQVEQLELADLPLIMDLQSRVKQTLVSDTFLSPLSEDEYTAILTGNGIMYGVFLDGKMIAFRAMLIPEINEEHLGIDAGLPQTALPKVIYSEISNVDPHYRGNGLQNYMGKLLLQEIDRKKLRYVCATVAPMNIASIKDKFLLGMQVVALKEKYDGKLRYIFIRDLTASSRNNSSTEEKSVPINDLSEQQAMIQADFRGTGIKKHDGTWYIQYKK